MKLKNNDRVKYADSIYIVLAVVWSTVYLQKANDDNSSYEYTMEQAHEKYHDIEFI